MIEPSCRRVSRLSDSGRRAGSASAGTSRAQPAPVGGVDWHFAADHQPCRDPAAQGLALAVEVRHAYQLGSGPLPDIEDLIGRLTGVDVAYRDLGGASGFCAVDPDRRTAIVLIGIGLKDTAERQRFTAAHELAHLLFPGDPKHRPSLGPTRPAEETRADEFARHLLIPLAGVTSWLQTNGLTEVTESELAALANTFRVSPQVVLIQLTTLRRAPIGLGESAVPTGRQLAYRHGWALPTTWRSPSQAGNDHQCASWIEPPRHTGWASSALRHWPSCWGSHCPRHGASLAEAGVVPAQRSTDQVVAAALSGHHMAGLVPDEQAQSMVRKIIDGDLTGDQVVEQLRASLPTGD